MSRKNIILLGILILIIGLVVLVASLPNKKTDPSNGGEGTNFFSDLFNFVRLNNKNPGEGTSVRDISNDSGNVEETKNALFKISSMPVAGYGVFKKETFTYVAPPENAGTASQTEQNNGLTAPETEYQVFARYVARENGNIYEYNLAGDGEKKYSASSIPTVYESFLGNNGSSVINRYLSNNKSIETFIRKLPEDVLGGDSPADNNLEGGFLPENTTDIALSPNGSNIFYLFNTDSVAFGVVANSFGTNKSQVFSSPYTEWLSQWPNKDLITLTTKPASGVAGYMYSINPSLKNFQKILGSINGLTTLTSPNGKLVLYTDDTLNLRLYDIENNDTKNLNVRTLPEKCVWGVLSDRIFCAVPQFIKTLQYPDSWYQGEVSFTDTLEEVSLNGGSPHIILKDEEVTEPFDAVKMSLSEDGNYLFFINKKDLFLWGLKLK